MGTLIDEVMKRRRAGDADGAIALLRERLKGHPNDVEAQIGLGMMLMKRDWVECISWLEKAGAAVPKAKRSRIYGALASAYDAVGKPEMAIASARLSLAAEPDRIGSALLLATMLAERREFTEALGLFQSLLDRVAPEKREMIEKAIAQIEAQVQLNR